MKTNFLPRNRRTSGRRRQLAFISVILVLALVGFSLFGKSLAWAFAPLWHSNLYVRTGLENLVGSLRTKDALIAENEALKEKLASDDELIISLRAIAESRNELLKSFGREPMHMLPGSVLVHPPETPYDILIVDAGDNLGIKPASLVYTPEGSEIGTVSDVFSKTSRVKLYSTAGERSDAVLERGGAAIVLVGRGGGNMSFTIARDIPVSVGDRVLSPRLESSLVGVVGDIEVTPTDSEKTVLVRSPINPNSQRFVLIENE